MKFLHISDLHFGKYMGEVSLVENDQRVWTDRFISVVDETGAEAVVIAGDVYDRSNPSNEAVKLFSEFITGLSEKGIPVLMVAGNHDSGQKLAFAESILEKGRVYIAGAASARIKRVILTDDLGEVTFWLVPYVFPALVNDLLGRSDLRDNDSAFRALLEAQGIDFSARNVIVAHQTVLHEGAEPDRGGSETAVAGVGGIEYTAFDGFEYAALGHIHRAQKVVRDNIRYAGSPLCYHFDETKYPDKGAVLVELGAKGSDPAITFVPIEPLHRVRVLTGTFDEVCEAAKTACGEYLRAEINGEITGPEMADTLRNIAKQHDSLLLEIAAVGTQSTAAVSAGTYEDAAQKSLSELFTEFADPDGGRLGEKEAELIDALAAQLERDELLYAKNAPEVIAGELIKTAIGQEV